LGFYLGIDAGGTKADYALADETRVLARVRSATIKRMRADASATEAALAEALAKLTAESGVSMQAVARTCIGTAGEKVPLVVHWLREQLAARVAGELILLGDVEIALDAAFPGAAGVLVLAGTGSNIAGRSEAGELIGAGGWGPALADQGSGHRIGLNALRAAFLAVDRQQPTQLLDAVRAFWDLASIEELIAFANRVPAPDFSRLTPLVVSCAEQGDAVASGVLAVEAEDLASLAALVIERLRRAAPDPGWTPPVAFTGSILEKVRPMREGVAAALQRRFGAVPILPGVVDPIDGALWRARGGVKS
jgi:N-acetylglucosamine kinase-like BadF-type ATPase